ncbi:plastocyanin/azurin family copper-binding protein [Halomicrococcus sp. SG-WS-1]
MGLHREVTGTHLYYCDPHRSLGMKGAVVGK